MKKQRSESAEDTEFRGTVKGADRMNRPWIERRSDYFEIHSKRNHAQFIVGKGKKHGFLVGIEWFQDYDWWNLGIGMTFLFWYITIRFHWRVFGEGYNRHDKEDIYI